MKRIRKTLADGTVRTYEYARAKYDAPARPAGDPPGLRHLCRLYKASPEWRRLAPATQRAYDLYLEMADHEIGWLTLSELSRREARGEFYAMRDRLAEPREIPVLRRRHREQAPSGKTRTVGGLHAADMAIRCVSMLLSWAVERGMIDANRAWRIPRLSEANSRAEIMLGPAEEMDLWAACGADLAALAQMSLYTMLRSGDVMALKWSDLDAEGWLRVTPEKTRRHRILVQCPTFALPPLKALIESLPRRSEFMLTNGGEAWTTGMFYRRWPAAVAAIGRPELHLHDLRGTAITRAYEAGCTDAEVGAMAGKRIARGSAKAYVARTRALALNGYQKWAAAMARPATVLRLEKETTETAA